MIFCRQIPLILRQKSSYQRTQLLKKGRILRQGRHVIKGNEIRGISDERRKWFITEANTSGEERRGNTYHKNNCKTGSQVIKETEIRGAYAEMRQWFITDTSTSVEERRENVHQNNLNRTRSGYREVKLLMEMKAVGHPLRGASDLSQRQALVSTDKIIYNGEKAETGPSIY